MITTGGALAGRVTAVGPDSATVTLLTDADSTVIGQLVPSAATGEVVGQLGGVLVMSKIDSGEKISLGDEVVTAGIELAGGIRSPYPQGPPHRPGRRRPARRQRRRPDRLPAARPRTSTSSSTSSSILDYEGGLPPISQQPVDCSGTDVLPQRRAAVLHAGPVGARRIDPEALIPGW